MANRTTSRVLGGIFIVMGLLLALTAALDLVQGLEEGLSLTFFLPALLAAFFIAGGTYILASGRGKKRGRP